MAKPDTLTPPRDADPNSRIALFVPEDSNGAAAPPEEHVPEFEIGHVLFVDIIGYSQLLTDEQSERLRELNELVRATRQFRRAEMEDNLMRLPTGDGMALVFRNSPEAPAQCALEISEALQKYPQLRLRMGIHSGPVNQVFDVNERVNLAGAGINIAQRVMDCGDAGHILISKHAAEDLEHSARWRPHLHDLGSYEVKHGVSLSLVNLYTERLGNPALPAKLTPARSAAARPLDTPLRRRARYATFIFTALLAAFVLASVVRFFVVRNRQRQSAANALPSISAPEKSIAVLPFDNLSANQETAFFTDGVQDEILTNLAKVADLKVISRTSVMQYRNQAQRNLREIGRQLGVAHILEGSVQRIGNHIRVNAQFIDARTDAHLWAQTYDRDLADVFAIQSEIAKTIAEQLQAKLSPKEEAALSEKPTTDLAAYDLYLHATEIDRSRASSIGTGGLEEAKKEVALLEEAIRRDPEFVAAYCLLAQAHLYLHWINSDQSADHVAEARKALEIASRLRPYAGEVHLTRAILHYWGAREYGPALEELAQARRSLPNDTRPIFFTALIERRQGKWEDSTRRAEQVLALDPCNITVISELAGTNYSVLERFADAARTLDNALAWKPNDFSLASLRANVDLAWKGDLRRWHAVIDGPSAATATADDLITARTDLALKERDYVRANRSLGEKGGTEYDDNGFFTPREWKAALIARGLGNSEAAQKNLLAARERAATAVKEQPDDAKKLMVLGQIDAALGRKAEAIREGERAVALLPIAKDAVNGGQLQTRLAGLYAQAGETDRAFDLLGKQLHQPFGPTFGSLKLEEVWDPLRQDPRFQKLITALAPPGFTNS